MLEQALQPIIARGGLEGEKFHLYVNPDKSIDACALGDNNIVVNEPMFRYFTVDELSGCWPTKWGTCREGHLEAAAPVGHDTGQPGGLLVLPDGPDDHHGAPVHPPSSGGSRGSLL